MMRYEKLIQKIQNADPDALETLWNEVKGFAVTIVKRYSPTASVGSEDLLQCAFLGVREAAITYDGRYKLLSWMAWMIRRECRRALSLDRRREPDLVSYDAPMGNDPDNDAFLDGYPDESLPESSEALELEELRRDVREAVEALPDRQREVIKKHYFDGSTLDEIARLQNVSAERIRQVKEKGLNRLRRDPVLRKAYKPAERRVFMHQCDGIRMSPVEREAMWNIERQRKAERRKKLRQAREKKQIYAELVAEGYFTQEEADARIAEMLEALGL